MSRTVRDIHLGKRFALDGHVLYFIQNEIVHKLVLPYGKPEHFYTPVSPICQLHAYQGDVLVLDSRGSLTMVGKWTCEYIVCELHCLPPRIIYYNRGLVYVLDWKTGKRLHFVVVGDSAVRSITVDAFHTLHYRYDWDNLLGDADSNGVNMTPNGYLLTRRLDCTTLYKNYQTSAYYNADQLNNLCDLIDNKLFTYMDLLEPERTPIGYNVPKDAVINARYIVWSGGVYDRNPRLRMAMVKILSLPLPTDAHRAIIDFLPGGSHNFNGGGFQTR